MLRRLYDWTLAKCAHPLAERWLAFISFAEASFFPVPPDALLAPMCLARPERAFRFAFICTFASVLGALLGYAIGFFLFETVGQSVLSLYGLADRFAGFAASFNQQGWLIVLIAGLTPLPFKVITIAAGATSMPLYILLLASVIARSARFFAIAGLLWRFGPPVKRVMERQFNLISIAFTAALLGGFGLIKLTL